MSILDGIDDAVVKLDQQATYLAMNRAAADTFRRLGRDPQDMMGKSVWQVFPEVKGTIVERELLRAVVEHATIQYEFYYPPDRHWYQTKGYPSREGLILIFRDITGQKTLRTTSA